MCINQGPGFFGFESSHLKTTESQSEMRESLACKSDWPDILSLACIVFDIWKGTAQDRNVLLTCISSESALVSQRTPYPHNAEHNGNADGTDCGQEACSWLRKKKRIPPKPRRIQSRNFHLGKRSQIRIRCLRRIPEEGTNSGRGGRSGRCVQQSAVQTADGTPSAIWRQLDAHKMARSSTPGKKGCHATWKLDLHAPTTDNGTSTRLPSVPCPLQCLHKGTGGSEQQWFKRVLTLADDGLIYKTSSDISTAVTAVQEQLEKVSHWCQETESEINPSKAQALWCTLNNKAVGQAMPAVSFNGEAIERTNSLRYLGMHFDRMLTFKTQVESTKLRCKKGMSALKAMASKGIEQRHLFLLYQSVILSVIDYGLGLTTLSQSNLLKLDRVQNEAMRVILGTTKDTPIETMRYLLNCHPWKQDIRWSKSRRISMRRRIPRIHSTMLSKKKRGVDWLEASHGWAKQNNQSSVCAVTQSSSK